MPQGQSKFFDCLHTFFLIPFFLQKPICSKSEVMLIYKRTLLCYNFRRGCWLTFLILTINVVNLVNQFKLMKHCFWVQRSEKQTTGDPDLIRLITLLLCVVELSKSRFSNLLSTIGLFVFIKTCLYTCYVFIHLTFLGLSSNTILLFIF